MNISAKIIADSVSPDGIRITTLELEYPRFIHAEFMTHRVFSRNAASSRAIPVAKVIEQVRNDPAMPVHWGKNQPGMQAAGELGGDVLAVAQQHWRAAALNAADIAEGLAELGLHKQVANRILEPFQRMKTVVTATEWYNFFELRCHPDAQPEIQVLACAMRDAMAASTPTKLGFGEWHLPYVESMVSDTGDGTRHYGAKGELSLTEALKISASCCAQVSYRKLDDSLDKALGVYERLVGSVPFHASPFEHQATPVLPDKVFVDNYLCRNFRGWVQHRALLEDGDYWLADRANSPAA